LTHAGSDIVARYRPMWRLAAQDGALAMVPISIKPTGVAAPAIMLSFVEVKMTPLMK
jgi:hypothetical protein